MKPGMPLITRLMSKVIVQRGCWGWTASTSGKGYAQMRTPNGKTSRAHRVSYQLFRGPIPEGLEIDHLCRNRSCVRPDHLEAVTSRENALRGIGLAALHAKKTTCPRGHPYDIVNHNGYRGCRACKREALRACIRRKRLAGYVNRTVAGKQVWVLA